MTNVTVLTKELVEQFEFAVGRKVTATEYMELRKQAVSELDAGYYISETQSVNRISQTTEQIMNNHAQNTMQMNNNALVSTMMAPVQRQTETSAISNSVTSISNPVHATSTRTPQPSVTNESVPPAAIQTSVTKTPVALHPVATQMAPIETDSNTDSNNDDDFFKLVNKFMV